MTKHSLSVVLPAFNEEGNIAKMVEHVISVVDDLDLSKYEVIVVDDGSKDRTGKILDDLANKYKSLHTIHHTKNRGYADALKTGFNNAEYPLIFYTDSDRQFDVNELKPMLKEIDDCDIICGYRAKRMDPAKRIFTAWVYNKLVNLIFGLNVRDVDCAFKLFKKKALDEINIESKGFLVDLEILSKVKQKGFTIKEFPITHYKREEGSSTVSHKAILKTISGILWLRRRLNEKKK